MCRFGELDTSHRVVSERVCVLILGKEQDKDAKTSTKLQASPSLLISGCFIFQPELVTMLVQTGAQPEQFQML